MSASFDSRHETAKIEENIHLCRAALLTCDMASAGTNRIDLEEALAGALMAMHDVTCDLGTLQEAILLYERLLDVDSAEHVHRVRALTGLGHALWRWCDLHDEDAVRLRRSIGLLREALDLQFCVIGDPARGDTLYALAVALQTCFKQLSDLGNLSEAVTLHREALMLRPLGHPLRDNSLHGLALTLFTRCEHRGGMDVLTEVISLYRQALHLRPPGHPRRDKTLNNLAIALHTSFEHYGGQDTMAEVTLIYREVLALRPIGHLLRARCLSNLAGALYTVFKDQGSIEVIAEATALCREALHLCPPGQIQRHSVLHNLADVLFESFQYHSDEDALSEAITLYREALSIRSLSHIRRSASLDGLARALQASFRHRGSTESRTLEEAMSLQREALLLRPASQPYRDETLHQLAGALELSYQQQHSPSLLAEAIALYREALVVRASPHPGRFLSLMGLASSLSRVATQSTELHSWREIVSLYEEALALCSRGHPMRARLSSVLGRCLLMPTNPVFDFDLGAGHLLEGLSDGFAPIKERLQNASEDLRAVEEACATSRPDDVDDMTQTRRSHVILRLYQQAIQLLPRIANFGLSHQTRYRTLMGSDEMTRSATTRAVRLGRVPHAIEILEEGRGMFWAQALRLRTSGLDDVPEADRVELQRLFLALEDGARNLTSDSVEQPPGHRGRRLENQRQLNVQVEALIAQIRSYSGLHRFLMPAAFDTLLQTLPEGFVIIVNASPLGCHALLLGRDGSVPEIQELHIPRSLGLDSSSIRAALPRDANYTAHSAVTDNRAMRLSKVGPQGLEDLLATLWTTVVSPIVHTLGLQKASGRARPRVWWCVTGELGFMPLHAAGDYKTHRKNNAADYIVSSYVPTLSALTKAHVNWQPVHRSDLTGLLVCEESSGPLHLPYVSEEICGVRECLEQSSVKVLNEPSEHTTVGQMQSLLKCHAPQAHILHLASHGVQETNPLESAFLLQDGRLAIADIMRLDLPRAVLAFLSACQTAKGDRNAPDQAVHLAASMLFCGFRSVVGTMWLMHDADGPQVARHFYERLLKTDHLDLDDIPYALDAAVCMLREAGVPPSRWALFVHMGG